MKMKLLKFNAFLALLLLAASAFAQVNAITEYGDTVVLMDNGNWMLAEDHRKLLTIEEVPLDTNQVAFSIPKDSESSKDGDNDKYKIWYNSEKWEPIEAKLLNPQAELAVVYQGEGEEAYAMTIAESLQIPVGQLQKVALQHATSVGSNVEVLTEEYREVNGVTVLYTEMSATVSGLDLVYHYYFASEENLSLQYIAFTGKLYASKMKPGILELLNGLVVNAKD